VKKKSNTRDRWPELCRSVEDDDGLKVRNSGRWTEKKLHFWNAYIHITTNSMVDSPKWPAGLAYVDLFAGPGVCRIEGTEDRIPGSPLIAAHAPKPFRKILLCELDKSSADACQERLSIRIPKSQYKVFRGDCNQRISEIVLEIPRGALTLAFIDPEKLDDLDFNTLRVLSSCGRVDLLILFPLAYDIIRNVEHVYFPNENSKLDRFLGPNSNWREKWNELGETQGPAARNFFANLYKNQLKSQLGYQEFGDKTISRNNSPLYRLIYASKHPRGLDFWHKITKKDSTGQKELF